MNRVKRTWHAGLSLLLVSNAALASGWSEHNLRQGVTEISRSVYDLHVIIFYICCAIGVMVFGAMIIPMQMHRRLIGAKPANFRENTKLETIWSVIPMVFLVALFLALLVGQYLFPVIYF